MQCPKCGKTYVQINGSFMGWQKIDFAKPDELQVCDSEPAEFCWSDTDAVRCLSCAYKGEAREFAANADECEACGNIMGLCICEPRIRTIEAKGDGLYRILAHGFWADVTMRWTDGAWKASVQYVNSETPAILDLERWCEQNPEAFA